MRTTAICFSILLGFLLAGPWSSQANAAAVLFAFTGDSELDDVPAGATMTRDDGNVANSVTLTSLEVKGPTYDSSGMWDGTSYTDSETSIQNSSNTLGINNLSSNVPWSNDSRDFHPGEFWTFEFDRDVIFSFLNLSSFSNADGDTVIFEIDSSTFTFDQGDLDSSDDRSVPFGFLVIPTGTDIKVIGGGDPNDPASRSFWRMPGFSVTPIGDIIDSVASGAAEVGTTWDSGAPVMADNLYRVVDGHTVSINASFAGLGLAIVDGTVDLNTNPFPLDLLSIEAAGTLNCSLSGDIELGDINTLPPMLLDGVINVTASEGADLYMDYNLAGSGEINFESNGATSDLWLSAAEGWDGTVRFNGTGDYVRLVEQEGLSGILEMNSTAQTSFCTIAPTPEAT